MMLCAILSFVFLLVHGVIVVIYNQKLDLEFIPNNEPIANFYTGSAPVWYLNKEEIGTEQMLGYLDAGNFYPDMGISPSWATVTLESDVSYYSSPFDATPVKVLKKGEEIYYVANTKLKKYFPENQKAYMGIELISGFNSFPSYTKGWRIAVPFFTVEELEKEDLSEIDAYYVAIEDLISVAKTYKEQWRKESTTNRIYYKNAVYWDYQLYRYGYYVSPDLYRSYFSPAVYVAYGIFGGCVVGIIIIRKKRKNKY